MERTRRRGFLQAGLAAFASTLAISRSKSLEAMPYSGTRARCGFQDANQDEFEGFSRYKPTRGNDPDSDFYCGKLVPGLRSIDEPPVPITAPDLKKLEFVERDGAKEFQIIAEPVAREFLPGYRMNVYGYNGSMPGPIIEIRQGDRIRILVTNHLDEPTFFHMHGFELPVQYDGGAEMTQNPIEPGETFKYEFDVHEHGTFFYHSHLPMQEAMGMVGPVIVHPRETFDPPVDRDFVLVFQNFFIQPNQTISDSWMMDWNWHTINGRSGPYTTPLVVKHGERVRIRLINFSPMQHHPIHLHGHTFWVTAREGARAPKSSWIPRNTELVAVAQASEIELIANNPGDWQFHCHMVHHMMNHMVQQYGPRLRGDSSVDDYLANLESRPPVQLSTLTAADKSPGYSQAMKGMNRNMEAMKKIWSAAEMKGMRATAAMSMAGLMTSFRVLPEDLFDKVMNHPEQVKKGETFTEIVRRFGDPASYRE